MKIKKIMKMVEEKELAVKIEQTNYNCFSEDVNKDFNIFPFSKTPEWLINNLKNGNISKSDNCSGWKIKTLSGDKLCYPGDWIFLEPNGSLKKIHFLKE